MSPSLMASTGHSGMQAPQATQESVILWAMDEPPEKGPTLRIREIEPE
jgi:hypothetical protein